MLPVTSWPLLLSFFVLTVYAGDSTQTGTTGSVMTDQQVVNIIGGAVGGSLALAFVLYCMDRCTSRSADEIRMRDTTVNNASMPSPGHGLPRIVFRDVANAGIEKFPSRGGFNTV
jgi:hypothetical protein